MKNSYNSKSITIYLLSLLFFTNILIAQTNDGISFITKWKTTKYAKTITIPTNNTYSYNYQVDCDDDGVFEKKHIQGNASCTYEISGEHIISIKGDFPVFYLNTFYDTSNNSLLEVMQWGTNRWESMRNSFKGAAALKITASDVPNLSLVTDMSYMFYQASSMNQNLTDWNVSTITKLTGTFAFASNFNQNISNWDVSSVVNMYGTFARANSFNQNLSKWDVSSVTNMNHMFTNITLSTNNYDALLIAWNALDLKASITFNGGYSRYSLVAKSARRDIIANNQWYISDAGLSTSK